MNAGPTSARIYGALKEMVTHRAFRPGVRLDPVELKDRLSSSITPIREALYTLAGEDLVTTIPNGGFYMAQIDEPGLCDLHAWTVEVLGLASRCWTKGVSASLAALDDLGLADRTEALFLWIARQSDNVEHGRAIERANARLHAARMVEEALRPESISALSPLSDACRQGDAAELRRGLARYYKEQEATAGKVIRELHRG